MTRAGSVALALALAACGGAAREGATAPVRGSSGGSQNQQSPGTEAPVTTADRAAWRECPIEGRSLWIATPEDAAFEAEGDGCFVLPGSGMTPETADWIFAVGLIERDHAHAELLGIEPDGARRFLVEETEMRDALPIGEGGVVLLDHSTRWYAVRGLADDLGARDIAIARVPVEGGWLVIVAGTRQHDQARLDALIRLFPMIRAR